MKELKSDMYLGKFLAGPKHNVFEKKIIKTDRFLYAYVFINLYDPFYIFENRYSQATSFYFSSDNFK